MHTARLYTSDGEYISETPAGHVVRERRDRQASGLTLYIRLRPPTFHHVSKLAHDIHPTAFAHFGG